MLQSREKVVREKTGVKGGAAMAEAKNKSYKTYKSYFAYSAYVPHAAKPAKGHQAFCRFLRFSSRLLLSVHTIKLFS